MGLKDKLNGLRIVRECWNRPEPETNVMTNYDCRRMGCPYVDGDCSVEALLDAMDVVERLEKKVKKLKKKGECRPDG